MHLEVLVEERSAEAALENILPRILPANASFQIHPFNGKQDLLKRLPARLRGHSRYLPDDWTIVVLIDADREDCRVLKSRLDEIARSAGLVPKTDARAGVFNVVNRIVMEELEAWFFGDPEALAAAYPRIRRGSLSRYRDPDAILGGTSEALARVLSRAGYYPSGMPKIEVARRVSSQIAPGRNRSHSFQVFRTALLQIAANVERHL